MKINKNRLIPIWMIVVQFVIVIIAGTFVFIALSMAMSK